MLVLLNSQAYDQVKELILEGKLVHGTIYSESQVAKSLGMSRTPLREALGRLRQEKIVDIIPSKGFMLHKHTIEDVIETFQVRSALEGYAATQLARSHDTTEGRQVIQEIAGLIEKQRKIMETSGDVNEFTSVDQEMHVILVGFVQNDSFNELFHNHLYRMRTFAVQSFAYPGRLDQTLQEHSDILRGLTEGNAEEVYSAVLKHMKGPVRIISKLMSLENKPIPKGI